VRHPKKLVLSALALTLSTGLVGTAVPAHAAPIPAPAGSDPAPVAKAAAYLAAQPGADNIIKTYYEYPPGTFDSYDDYGLTIDAGYALDAVGGQAAKLAAMTDALQAGIGSYAFGGGSRAKLASFLLSQGRTGAEIDELVTNLEGHISEDAGIVGRLVDAGDDFNSPLTQSYAVSALHDAESEKADEALAFLLAQQCDEGFVREYFPAKEAADQTCDGADAPTPSIDTTGLAVLMLQDQKADPAVATALAEAVAWLASQQGQDGSFGNANSTGIAGWALGVSGNTAAASAAAGWVRAHQLANAGACTTYAAKDDGAIILDDLGLANAASGPLGAVDNSVATRATTQALPTLLWAPAGPSAGVPDITATTKLVKAGSTQTVGLAGAPGDTLCVTGADGATRAVLPASGAATASVTLPAKTRTTTVSVVDAGGQTDTAAITGLAAKTIRFSMGKKVTQGKKVVVKVKGLAAGEKIVVKFRGAKVAKATANGKGKKTLRFVATGLGRGKVLVRGQFGNRKNSKAITVVR
jgi:hypothetical protein